MSDTPPVPFFWDGEAMRPPSPHWSRRCDQNFVVGETYLLAPHHERSAASHRHYFSCIAEAWQSLPEHLVEQFPTPEVLRKKALIKAGYRDERSIVCASKAEAQRVAAFIRPLDDTAIVIVRDAVVLHLTAKSQSMRAMGKQVFQESKDAVLGVVSAMIDVAPETLRQNVGRAA